MSSNTSRPFKGKNVNCFPSTYHIIDIETTGLNPKKDEIIELAALRVVDGVPVASFQELVKPKIIVSPLITNLTGITNEMLRDARSLEYVIRDFVDFVGADSVIIGHNVNFDINFIYDKYTEIYDVPFKNDYIDTLKYARKLLPELDHHRLCDLAEYYNIDVTIAHRALADCYTTYELFKKLKHTAKEEYVSLDQFFETFSNNRRTYYDRKYSDKKVDIKALKPETSEFDETHPLFNKHCCFTGTLSKLSRQDALQLVVNYGGFCDNSVTKRTDILVVGLDEYGSNHKSSKLKKAEEYINRNICIDIISENIFYDIIEEKMMDIKVYGLIPPENDFVSFKSLEEKIKFLKELGIISKKAEEIKPLFYKGVYADDYCVCDIVGYVSKDTLVISMDSHLHCINTDCFIEMQPKVKEQDNLKKHIPIYCEEKK